jgi:hypothetical protein
MIHNHEVGGSIPPLATPKLSMHPAAGRVFLCPCGIEKLAFQMRQGIKNNPKGACLISALSTPKPVITK